MAKTIRQVALECLLELDQKQQSIGAVVDAAIRKHKPSRLDASLLTEFVYGVLRWRGRLDWVIKLLVERPPEIRVQYILRLGLYQLIFMDRIPEHAALYETVELGTQRQKRFLNAVLRNAQRQQEDFDYPTDPVERTAVVHSFPFWLAKRWHDEQGPDWTEAFCKASNQQAPLEIRLNTLATDMDSLTASLTKQGCTFEPLSHTSEGLVLSHALPVSQLDAFDQGWFFVQDQAAMLVVQALDPQPGDFAIDVCAAPGGKTTHMAQRMQNRGLIHAIDQSPPRLQLVEQNCQRLGIEIVRPWVRDGQNPIHELRGAADRVLVDVPCSGFGTLRRHPDIRWKRRHSHIIELAKLQLRILEASATYVKDGGTLVYSTCTTESSENQDIIAAFLTRHSTFDIQMPEVPPDLLTDQRFIQTLPHRHGMDGFFIAKLIRR